MLILSFIRFNGDPTAVLWLSPEMDSEATLCDRPEQFHCTCVRSMEVMRTSFTAKPNSVHIVIEGEFSAIQMRSTDLCHRSSGFLPCRTLQSRRVRLQV
jgi:hypothetical protein